MSNNYSCAATMREGVEVFTLRAPSETRAEVAPALGCNCFAFAVGQSVLEPVAFEDFRQKPTSYGIPILFPFPNRIRDGRFTFQGRTFEINPPRHGFVRDKPWRVLASGADDASAWLTAGFDARDYAEQILAQFPFPFQLEVTYRLRADTLEMETVARNMGDADMPAGFGIHPYFRKPARGTLSVPAFKRWELVDSLPTGRLLDVTGAYDLRGDGADVNSLQLDDIYTNVLAEFDGRVRCALSDEEAQRQTIVEFYNLQFSHVVVYTPPAPRRSVCVEPNTCPTDAFNLQARGVNADVIVLRPGEERRFTVRIQSLQMS